MRITLIALLLAASLPAQEPRKLVEKALDATGWGKANSDHATWKDKGKLYFGSEAVEYASEVVISYPDKYRWQMAMKVNNVDLSLMVILSEGKGWETGQGKTQEITGNKLAYLNDELLQINALALKPLLDAKLFELAMIDNATIDGANCPGISASRKDRPTVKIWFDPATGLPKKLECKVKNEFDDWKEATDEMYLGDWSDAGGVKSFKSMKIVRNGKLMIEATCSDFKQPEKVDPKLYDKPQ